MFDMAKALKDINDATNRNVAVIALQEQILAAQLAQSTLIERVRELEGEMARVKAWEAEKQRYKLEELPPGVFVRTLKPDMAAGEPMHRICQTCYERGKKSVLNASEPYNGQRDLTCNECGSKLTAGIFRAEPW
jgi:hypothetical protein